MKAPPTDWVAGYDAAVKLREKNVAELMKKTGAKRNPASKPLCARRIRRNVIAIPGTAT